MNLGRIFANAIVRRLAYVLVAIALAWLGLADARAQTVTEARAMCQAWTTSPASGCQVGGNYQNCECRHNAIDPDGNGPLIGFFQGWREHKTNGAGMVDSGYRASYASGCPEGQVLDPETGTCGTCSEKPALGPSGWSGVTSSMMMCRESCEFEGGVSPGGGVGVCGADGYVVDGTKYIYCTGWSPTGNTCALGSGGFGAGEPSESPSDTDGDGTSDGNDSAPNNPGQGGGGGENGEGQPEDGSGTCGGDGQPACGSLGTGSGNGNTSGGGQDCNTPPSSTGDAILAQIAYQTWATRCAITGMGNAGPGNGTGNGDGSGEGTGGEFDGDAEGRDAAMEGDSEDPEREDVVEEPETEEPELDTSGYGYSRACVAAPTVTVFGQTITFDTGPMCQWLELASYFVLLLAALGSARIINGGMA